MVLNIMLYYLILNFLDFFNHFWNHFKSITNNTVISRFKKGASGSVLITTIFFELLTPAKCCIAPEIPTAIYKSGFIAIPV